MIVSSGKVHSVGKSLKRRTMTKTHTEHERLKHVTNDSRLDLSFIIVPDTCRRHHPLFYHLRNNNSCGTSRNRTWFLLYRQMHKSKYKKRWQRFANGVKKSHISWRHKHVFNISARKHDKLRFNQLWKYLSLLSSHLRPPETNNFPIKTFLSAIE